MAITKDDFARIWASTSPLTPYSFSDSNYQEGWNFVGATPPARQMWDFLQKLTDEKLQYIYDNMIPTGVVQAFAGATTPTGWLLCDGSAVSRTDYADLYAVIGDTYGAGDGTTTFNLPDLADKFIQGNATAGTVKNAGLPNIKGNCNVQIPNNSSNSNYILPMSTSGAFDTSSTGTRPYWVQSGTSTSKTDWDYTTTFDASRSSSVYSDSVTTVQPPALTMRYIIKY